MRDRLLRMQIGLRTLRRLGVAGVGVGWLALCVVFGAAIAEPAQTCGGLPNLGDGWETASPAAEGFDPDSICTLGPRLAALKEADPHGVVVVRHGKLVYEAYFSGDDGRWPQQHWNKPLAPTPHDARTKHDLQSMTKSVTALLVGIALDRGDLKSLDAPVLSFFPSYADLQTPDRLRITVRDVLTMRTGLRWQYKPYLSMARRMDAAPDPFRFFLEQPVTGTPGKTWRYNNGTAEIAGAIVHRASGVPLDQFAKRYLFDPLGIDDWEWGRMANGDPGASWGLRLRPRDLAKIGQLVLNRGTWRGHRVVSSEWIEQMIAPHVIRPHFKYGYLWWLDRRTVDGREVDVVEAIGWGGQYLEVIPSLDMVLVVTAGLYDFKGGNPQGLANDAALEMVLRATRP
ncbi:MAG: serine hydrolase [Proteobacteria bacterium]|nr:serine hydrolase [Pseudomonadota bacterium]